MAYSSFFSASLVHAGAPAQHAGTAQIRSDVFRGRVEYASKWTFAIFTISANEVLTAVFKRAWNQLVQLPSPKVADPTH